MRAYGLTDVGRVRSENQDNIYFSQNPVGALKNLFIVADGMGGHKAGAVASQEAIETILRQIKKSHLTEVIEILDQAITLANASVYIDAEEDPSKAGMGTTLVAATVDEGELYVANVGDSRLYLFDGEKLTQITEDHSVVEELVRRGSITEQDARIHPQRNRITRAIGVTRNVRVDYFDVPVSAGDQILLCSDGLSNMLENEQIETVLRTYSDIVTKTETLIAMALEAGGSDNTSAVLIEI